MWWWYPDLGNRRFLFGFEMFFQKCNYASPNPHPFPSMERTASTLCVETWGGILHDRKLQKNTTGAVGVYEESFKSCLQGLPRPLKNVPEKWDRPLVETPKSKNVWFIHFCSTFLGRGHGGDSRKSSTLTSLSHWFLLLVEDSQILKPSMSYDLSSRSWVCIRISFP